MEIKASSKYDWETIKKFNKFHNFTRTKALNIGLIILDVVCVLLFLLAAAINILDFETIMIYVLLLFVNIMLVFVRFILPKIQYKQNKMLHGVVNEATFKDNEMSIEQRGENVCGATTVKYDAVWRVYEIKDFIYIYVNSRQAYIVDKATVTGGTAADLRMFLMKTVGMGKYKVKSKS